MSDAEPLETPKIRVRRYPNRRYYDATHSQHVTLEAIYELILEGNDVQVTDSKSGEDITAKVLTQIILEHETPKLDAFPVGLLHRLIRTNEPLVREFVEKHFSHAFSAFVESQRQLSDYLRDSMGLSNSAATTWPWGPFPSPFAGAVSQNGDETNASQENATQENGDADLRQTVEQLQEQVQKLQEKLSSG